MIIFKCNNCGEESDSYHKSKNTGEIIPTGWITISAEKIHNENGSAALTYAGNNIFHFCTQKCMINQFFKQENTIALFKDSILQELDKLIAETEESSKLFKKSEMNSSELTSQAMSFAYNIVKTLILSKQ